ncbi:MAG: hypothetical protein EOO90_19395 [Pedobacter sp.]|nr:MAG: hypothetical protein EOO90_19395 [Pedobacter sp.]
MKNVVAIIIPIYKAELSESELMSLAQCLKILSSHPIIFIAPWKLNTDFYHRFCYGRIDFNIFRFENFYFEDINGYNKLMLDYSFYKRFLDYRYILVYQLDSFVFKDELLMWCEKGYDYIGAPQISNHPSVQFLKNYGVLSSIFNHKISNVGNGGFSLRKVKKIYWILRILKLKVHKWLPNNEDVFFKYWGNILYPIFKLPEDDIACEFSIETNVEKSLAGLHNKLPFGCHAFEKYAWNIWKPIIKDSI